MILVLAALSAGAAVAGPASVEACEAAVREHPAALESYRCFWLLARQNRAAEAERALRSRLLRDPANHRARLYLARLGGDQGRDWAEPMYREAVAGLAAGGDAEGEVFARLGLSLFLNRRHRVGELEAEIAAAARRADETGDPILQAWVLNEKATLAFRKSDYGAAGRMFEQVAAQVVPDGPPELQALCLGGLAGVAQETGRSEESADLLRRQADLNHLAGDFYDEARARGNLVLSGFRLGIDGLMEPDEIVRLAREALAAAVAGGNRGSEARAHLYLGDLLPGREGREHYEEGLAISRETKETAGLILGRRGLALSLVESEPRDPARAFALVEEAIELARGSNFYTAIARLARARMRWIAGPREQAVADSLSALEAIEALRDLQDDGAVRARVFSLWAFAYARLAGRLLQGDPTPEELELAFAVTERMRARVLLDELDAAQATGRLAPGGPTRERRAAVLKALAQVQRRLMDPALDEGGRRRARAELERLEREEAALRAELGRAHPAYAAWRQPAAPPLPVLRAAIAPDEAILAFQVTGRRNVDNRTTEDGSWVWVHTRETTRVYAVPDQDVLRPAVSLFVGLFDRRDGSEAEAGVPLYDELLSRPLADLPPEVTRLVIVPDGVLHRLPFDALRPAPPADPLGARFQTSLAPSVTLWRRWRGESVSSAPDPALVLADPELPAPAPPPAATRTVALEAVAGWGSLPHARAEARFVARQLGGGSRLLLGGEASERVLKQADLRRFAILHLAAHAWLDDREPQRSAIVLTPGAPDEDGLLQIREVVGLDLQGRLVVLSACRTASGAVLAGEGVMGLARAFFQAGARTVVGSLWPLRDDEAEQLIRGFYRHLAEGRSVAAALASARRDLLRSGAPAAAWAGLVVLGDGEAVPLEPRPEAPPVSRSAAVLTAGVSLALVAVLAFRRLRRRRA